MNVFHTHEWVETERMCAKRFDARELARLADDMSEAMAERLLFGVTTIILRCQSCGDVKTVEFLGV